MERTVYVVRENHKDLGSCFIGHGHVLVKDVLDAWMFKSGDAAKKVIGEPETVSYEIVPLHIDYELDEDYVILVEPYVEDEE